MISKVAGLAGCLLVSLGAGPDPVRWSRLGSPRYADRQAAATALERLGQDAFPALKVARNDRDPEVKSRAEQLLDTIERSMLTRPTMTRFEARRYSLSEIAEQLGAAQGVALPLAEMGNRETRARRYLGSRSAESLSFWEALDRVGLGLQAESDEPEFGRPLLRRPPIVRLVPQVDARATTSDHGPFRLFARPLSIEVQPDFDRFRNQGFFPPPRQFRPLPTREPELVVPIDVQVEPHMAVRSIISSRILEAVDDRGETLSPALPTGTELAAGVANFDRGTPPSICPIRFHPPSRRPRAISRLKGILTVEVEAKKGDPTVIPLNAQTLSDHRPIDCGGLTIIVNGLTSQSPTARNGSTLDLTIRPDGWVPPLPRRGMRGRGFMWNGPQMDLDQLLQNIEVVDGQGRAIQGATTRDDGADGDGQRMRLYLPANSGADSSPAELRYYGQIRANVEVPFEFQDLDFPGR